MTTLTIETLMEAKRLIEAADKYNPFREISVLKCSSETRDWFLKRLNIEEANGRTIPFGIPVLIDENVTTGQVVGLDRKGEVMAILNERGLTVWKN